MKVVFDNRCPNWLPDIEYNVKILEIQRKWLNDYLKHRGYVSIMDVFYHLRLPAELSSLKCKTFEEICWVYEEGDYIDFEMELDEETNIIYLDFNIDID